MSEPLRVAVVTPYYKESPAVLQRCMESVRAQSHPQVVHYMVADGFPQHELMASWPQVRHIVLPHAHANYGCTPRGIGALCALADDVDIVSYLDADNLFLPGHAASVVQVVEQQRANGVMLDAVFASRHLFLPGHEHLRLEAEGEGVGSPFVDTSCISLTRSAGFLWGVWCRFPRSLTPACDRVMCSLMQHHQLKVMWTQQHTVLYESNWRPTYLQAGLEPPEHGLHDDTLLAVGEGLTPDEIWALLRVQHVAGNAAPAVAPPAGVRR